MCRLSCCPTLKWSTVMAIVSIIDIIVFIVVIAIGGTVRGDPASPMNFLTPNSYYLWLLGDKDPYYMKGGPGMFPQVWRFMTPVFLHGSLAHIIYNVLSQLLFGSMIESMAGFKRTLILYFGGAIGGNLLGALVSDSIAVGASTALLGLLGAGIGWLVLNWKALENTGLRCIVTCYFVMIVIMNLLFGMGVGYGNSGTSIDWCGHLGGLYTGIFLGMFVMSVIGNRNTSYEKNVEKLGVGLLVIWFVLGFSLFYTVRHPINQGHPDYPNPPW